MKRLLLYLPALLLLLLGAGCSEQRKWNREQRKQMRTLLRDYRQQAYLNDLNDAEFILFTNDVTDALEEEFPVYTSFVALPGAQDTVQVYVVTTVVEELKADAHNMRHIFPYEQLVEQGILPQGLTYAQRHAFYNCLAGKVSNTFATLTDFVNAVMADTLSNSQIGQLQAQCANALFDYQVTGLEIIDIN